MTKVISPEQREKIAAKLRGRTLPPETRAKMSAAQTGKSLSAEHRQKIAASNRGQKRTPETCARVAAARRARPPKNRMADCHPDRPHAGRGMCRACYKRWERRKKPESVRASARRSYAKHREKYKARQAGYSLKSRYGLTPEKVGALVASQGGCCAICKRPTVRLVVDHCHSTGRVRGMLCSPCNMIMGFVDANAAFQASLADYVERNK